MGFNYVHQSPPFASKCAEDDLRSKSLLLWQAIRLKVIGLNVLKHIYHRLLSLTAKCTNMFSWTSSFDIVAIGNVEGRQQRIENDRLITSNSVYREVL
jgi:hypothetical protein